MINYALIQREGKTNYAFEHGEGVNKACEQ
jgi:hypothetical protein